jgi:hypothetical protein
MRRARLARRSRCVRPEEDASLRLHLNGIFRIDRDRLAVIRNRQVVVELAEISTSTSGVGDTAYLMLFRYLARARAGESNAGPRLEAEAKRLNAQQWPYPVIELLTEKRSVEATLQAARTDTENCEARFYIGQWHLLRRNARAAAPQLKFANDKCPRDYPEYTAAVAELKRLSPSTRD